MTPDLLQKAFPASRAAQLMQMSAQIAEKAPTSISSAADVKAGQEYLASAKKFVREVGEERLAVTRQIDAVKKGVMEVENAIVKAALEAINRTDKAINLWLNEQERLRQEAERKARIEAERRQAQFQALATLKANILRGFADMTADNALSSVDRLKSLSLKPEAYGDRFSEAQTFVSEQILAFQARATELLSGDAEQLDRSEINAKIEAAKDQAAEQAAVARFEAAANVPATADVKNVRTVEMWAVKEDSKVAGYADLLRHYLRTGGDVRMLDFLVTHAKRTMSEAPEYIEVKKELKANARS